MRKILLVFVLFSLTFLSFGQKAELVKVLSSSKDQSNKSACIDQFAGTINSINFSGQSNTTDIQDTIYLCFNDAFDIIHNGDANLTGDPNPGTQPGVGYAFYDCEPTISGPDLATLLTDNCLVPPPGVGPFASYLDQPNGDAYFSNTGYIQNTFNGGDPMLMWFAPVTFDFFTANQNGYETAGPCVNANVNEAFPVVYLNELEITNCITNVGGDPLSGSFSIGGGLAEFDGSEYKTVAVLKKNNANIKATINGGPFTDGSVVNFTVPESGTYLIIVEDGVSCGVTKEISLIESGNEMLTTIGTVSGEPGDYVCVDFCGDSFGAFIAAMQYSINFDPNVLAFNDITILPNAGNPDLPDLSLANFVTFNADIGIIGLVWLDFSTNGIPIDFCMFQICFDIIGDPGECSPICISDNPIQIEISDNQTENVNHTVVKGEVCIDPPITLEIYGSSCGAPAGSNDGSLSFVIYGGNGPYNYSGDITAGIANAGQEITINDLNPGVYDVDVIDQSGSTTSITITIATNNLLDLSLMATDPTCFGFSNGTVGVDNLSGGAMPYEYAWSNFLFDTDNISNLGQGTYILTVTDANGCTTTASQFIGKEELVIDLFIQDTTSCIGSNDGVVIATASGGTGINGNEYFYQWFQPNPLVQQNISSTNFQINEGNMSLKVTDDNNCTTEETLFMPVAKTMFINLTGFDDMSCNDADDGFIEITASVSDNSSSNYSFGWDPALGTNGPNVSFLDNLEEGSYFVTVVDAINGCVLDTFFEITNPPLLDISNFTQSIDCTSGDNGNIQLFPTGGTPTYSFLWNDNSVDNPRSGLDAGTYTVTVTDANGCNDSLTIDLFGSGSLMIDSFSIIPISCPGDENGQITVVINSSNPNLTYNWTGPNPPYSDSPTITNIGTGLYSITVMDDSGCMGSADTLYSGPEPISLTTMNDLPSCNGESNGAINTFPQGGLGPYIYVWDHPNNTGNPSLASIPAGDYGLNIVDANGCVLDTVLTLDDQLIIDIQLDAIPTLDCFGDANGTATATATGGPANNGNYGFLWDTGEEKPFGPGNTSTANMLQSGDQMVIVFDSLCADTLFFEVIEPAVVQINPATVLTTDVSCYGLCDGTSTISAIGGTTGAGYSYNWLNSGTQGPNVSNLCAGYQVVEITDGNNCVFLDSVLIDEPDSLQLQLDQFVTFNPPCNATNQGSIGVVYAGGNAGPVSYTWTNNVSDKAIATDLAAGFYGITVTDIKGCTDTVSITLIEPTPIEIEWTQPLDPACFGDQTCITIDNVTGGGGPQYRFNINNGPLHSLDTCINVFAGVYSVKVFDMNACSGEIEVIINQPPEMTVSLGPDIEVELGDSTRILKANINAVNQIASIEWNPVTDLECITADCSTVYVYPSSVTVYTVTVIDENGCIAEDEIEVRIDDNRNIYIPNIFTPDGDGINDYFQIFTGSGVEGVNYFYVFDRWGNQMYSVKDLDPNPGGTIGWNGSYLGRSVNPGVYTYVAEIQFIDGVALKYRGSVTLIR
jgi:gliding motility-associated-like protein